MRTHPQPIPDLYPDFRPTLDLNFAATRTLDPRITFTRGSAATFVGATGAVETAATNVPRFTHSPVSGLSQGLLIEESRTNRLLNSAALETQNITVTATAHTLSFSGAGTITLSGASTAGPLVGIGAGEVNRVRLTFTPTAGTLTVTVSGTVTNAQIEAGAFATNYIPTGATAATRAADVATITGGNFASWYRQDEGTWLVGGVSGASSTTQPVFIGDESGKSPVYKTTTSRIASWNGSSALSAADSFFPAGANVLAAMAYSTAGRVLVVSGSALVQDAAIYGLSTGMRIGCVPAGQFINGPIARIRYWPRRFPAAVLQRLTAPTP